MATTKIEAGNLIEVTVRGTLISADFSANSCRISDNDAKVNCTYPDRLKPAIKDALGDFIEAFGQARTKRENGTSLDYSDVHLEHLNVLERGPASVNQLKPITPQALRDIGFFELGAGREDDDEVEESARELREQSRVAFH